MALKSLDAKVVAALKLFECCCVARNQSELCVLYLWFLYMSRCLLTEIHHLEENTAEKLQACNGNKRGGKMGQNANKLISH